VANDTPTPTLPRARPRAGEGREGGATYFYRRDIGRIWRIAEALEHGIAEALEHGIAGIKEGIISTEIAPFGA
jgi:hypothetical protein